MATVRIPTPLRPYAANQTNITVTGNSVGEALDHLTEQYPDLRHHLFEGDALRSFVNVYLNEEDIRHLDGAATPLGAQDKLMIVPSIAGGGSS